MFSIRCPFSTFMTPPFAILYLKTTVLKYFLYFFKVESCSLDQVFLFPKALKSEFEIILPYVTLWPTSPRVSRIIIWMNPYLLTICNYYSWFLITRAWAFFGPFPYLLDFSMLPRLPDETLGRVHQRDKHPSPSSGWDRHQLIWLMLVHSCVWKNKEIGVRQN